MRTSDTSFDTDDSIIKIHDVVRDTVQRDPMADDQGLRSPKPSSYSYDRELLNVDTNTQQSPFIVILIALLFVYPQVRYKTCTCHPCALFAGHERAGEDLQVCLSSQLRIWPDLLAII